MSKAYRISPGLLLAGGLAAGICLQKVAGCSLLFTLLAGVVTGVLYFIRHHPKERLFFLFILFVALGAIRFRIWEASHLEHPLQKLLPIESTDLTVNIIEPPQTDRPSFLVSVEKIDAPPDTIIINRLYLCRTSEGLPSLVPGDRLKMERVGLENTEPPRNPGQVNYARYLEQRGVAGIIRLRENSRILRIRRASEYSISRLIYSAGQRLDLQIHQMLPEAQADFLAAVLLGHRQSIEKDITAAFQNTGVAHVLAISGLHVGFVVIIIHLLLSFLPIGFRWQNWLTLVFLLVFMLLTGARPPVVRATLMVSVYLMGKNLERKPGAGNTVFIAAFLILIFQPQQLFWVDFQFSFAAVLAILFFYRRLQPLESATSRFLPVNRLGRWIRRWVVQAFLISLAAQLGTLPLIALYFHKIPLISFFLNILVVPLIGVIVGLGIGALLLSFFVGAAAAMLAGLLNQVILFMVKLVQAAAHLPFAYFSVPNLPVAGVAIYVLVILLILYRQNRAFMRVQLPAWGFIGFLLLWILLPVKQPAKLWMLDVGQGDAHLYISPTGKSVLIDAGPANTIRDSGRDIILPALASQGINHLDKLILSHPHADHVSGLFSLCGQLPIDSVYFPRIRTPIQLQEKLINRIKADRIPFRLLQAGDMLHVDSLSTIFILAPFPPEQHPNPAQGASVNNTSVVALIKSRTGGLLFTGDAETRVEQKLLGWGAVLQAAVLKLGHHGSATSSGEEFLRAVGLNTALVPVGRNNKFGHPSPEVMKRLKRSGVAVYRTDLEGAVLLEQKRAGWKKTG